MGGLINIEAVGSATTIAKVTTNILMVTRVNKVTIKGSEDQDYGPSKLDHLQTLPLDTT